MSAHLELEIEKKDIVLKRPSVLTEAEAADIRKELMFDPELEKSLRTWISETLEEDLPNGSMQEILMDGSILCRLANKIVPGAIHPSKWKESKLPYIQRTNIVSFLESCYSVFNIPKIGFFDVSDLYDSRNIPQVMNNLYLFAKVVEKLPDYNGPKISFDQTKAGSLFSASLVGGHIQETVVEPLSEDELNVLYWANTGLERTGTNQNLRNLTIDIQNGVKLIALIEVLSKQSCTLNYIKKPSTLFQYMANATFALNFLASISYEKIQLCSAQDIVRGNKEKIVDLLKYIREKFDYDYMFHNLLSQQSDQKTSVTKEITLQEGQTLDDNYLSQLGLTKKAIADIKHQYRMMNVAEIYTPRAAAPETPPEKDKKTIPDIILIEPKMKLQDESTSQASPREEDLSQSHEDTPKRLRGSLKSTGKKKSLRNLIIGGKSQSKNLEEKTPKLDKNSDPEKKQSSSTSKKKSKNERRVSLRIAAKELTKYFKSTKSEEKEEEIEQNANDSEKEGNIEILTKDSESAEDSIGRRKKRARSLDSRDSKRVNSPTGVVKMLTKKATVREKRKKEDNVENIEVVFVNRPTTPTLYLPNEEANEQHSTSTGVIEDVILEKNLDGTMKITVNRIQAETEHLQSAQNKMKEHVFRELVNTEKSYVDNLSVVIKGLYNPIGEQGILTDEQRTNIFSNLPSLTESHSKFFDILKERLFQWKHGDCNIGDIFIKHTNFLSDYESYLTNYVSSLIFVHHYKKESRFNTLLKYFEQEQASTTMLNVASFLVMPVQRIPRYILLLRDLQKYTEEDSKDFEWIGTAIEKIDGQLQKMNANIDPTVTLRMKKVLSTIDAIQGFSADLFNKDRALHYEGTLKFKKSKKFSKKKNTYCFLFNDIFVYCVENEIDDHQVSGPPQYTHVSTLSTSAVMAVTAYGDNGFQIVVDSQDNWIMIARTTEEREKWMKEMNNVLREKREIHPN